MIKKIFVPILISVLSVFISLGLIEVGFRLFASKAINKWSDRPRSYFISEDAQSFQDYPHTVSKPGGVYRIAVIGDSFTFAPYMQFDDAFPKRLERYLNLNTGTKKVEVINYGVPAYSTSHEVPVVKRALEEGADLILMEITLNDPEIKPYTPQQLYKDKNKFGELELNGKIYQYWTSLAFVLRRIHNNETYDNYVKKFFNLFDRPKTWANFSNSWTSIVEAANAKKIPLVAVVFPLYGIPLDTQYPFLPIHEKVKTFLDSLQVRSLDLYKDFQGIPLDRLQVIVGQDFHPNEIGHRIAAESILDWWHREKILPEEFYPRISSPQRIGIRKPGSAEAPKEGTPKDDPSVNDEGDES